MLPEHLYLKCRFIFQLTHRRVKFRINLEFMIALRAITQSSNTLGTRETNLFRYYASNLSLEHIGALR